ncbi:hypothetical protein BOX15_Mlig032183g1, partial [Macrostomum lignano]
VTCQSIMALSKSELAALCKPPPPETSGFIMQQTMLRVKDPRRSLDFYSSVLGMRLLGKFDFPSMAFSLYFMGYAEEASIPKGDTERIAYLFRLPGTVELTHNYGTESDPDQAYHNGNSDPRGFGHIGISVPDVAEACRRFERLGVKFAKKPDDGKMKGLAFILDPDGYWIEILNAGRMVEIAKVD